MWKKKTINVFSSVGEWVGMVLAILAITVISFIALVIIVGVPAAVILAFPLVFYKLLTLYDSHSWAITVLALTIFGAASIVSSVSHAWVAKHALEKVIMYRYSNYNLIIMLGLMFTTVMIVFLAYK